jgi:Mor family transcriptional regulator
MLTAQQTLAEAVGEAQARRLIDTMGGASLYIPRHPSGTMLQRMTLAEAEALCAQLGGESVEIPRCYGDKLALRDDSIRADAAAGVSRRDLALQYGITERQIRRIIAAANTHEKGYAR